MDPSLVSEIDRHIHGAAWGYFCKAMAGKRFGAEETRDSWEMFLTGWLAKAQQRQDFRKRA